MKPENRGFQPINFLFGMMMGGADIIPGVSGGTIALIVGIYERLIGSVRDAASGAAAFLTGRIAAGRESVRDVEWGLVLPLAVGILTAIVLGARIIEPALEAYPVQLRAVFFGLIAGSLSIPWKRIPRRQRRHVGIAVAAALFAFVLTGLPPSAIADPALPIVFLAASIAICAMILPGISGAFLLLVMGMYEPTLRALNGLDFAYIVVFAAGAAIGLGVFSKLLSYLIAHHHDVTMVALVGLMAGSLRALWPYQTETRRLLGPPSVESLLIAVLLGVVGFAVVTFVARIGLAAERRHEAARLARVDTHEGPP
ncbi:MAG TPA: DUF368 domain-containing protein [Longimicrobiaceae bacterium]|nr:DUF368 domain-containing protein [Longimicrobiaceae bacterium]